MSYQNNSRIPNHPIQLELDFGLTTPQTSVDPALQVATIIHTFRVLGDQIKASPLGKALNDYNRFCLRVDGHLEAMRS